jgi:hypothetical protein
MALYLLKPVLWNTVGYRHPSGVRAGGFPGQNGFGHEEWNNSPRMILRDGGHEFRVFHTEGVGNAPVEDHAGQTFVFMTASHDRIQQLVGVAGNAVCLAGDQHRAERERICEELGVHSFWEDAWAVPRVQETFGTRRAFLAKFNKDVHWIPNWVCPARLFLWFDEPVTLNAPDITGSTALPKMFGKYMPLHLSNAVQTMNSMPTVHRTQAWHDLMREMQSAPSEPIVSSCAASSRATTRIIATQARCGQGDFRENLLRRWQGRCAVTGLDCPELLIASHIEPWADSTDRARLDVENGLLLAAHLDRLFDKGLITFSDEGDMLLSSELGRQERDHFGLPLPLRFRPSERMTHYLEVHRSSIFRP